MDILAHALYGAALCSRSGVQSIFIKQGNKKTIKDWTFWASCFFAVIPDLFSLGIYFSYLSIKGIGIRWYGMPYPILFLYKILHSLPSALLIILLIRFIYKPLVLPSLAWPLHIVIDAFLHDQGKFKTPLFFPFINMNIKGINWWENPWVVEIYWLVLMLLWIIIIYKGNKSEHRTSETVY